MTRRAVSTALTVFLALLVSLVTTAHAQTPAATAQAADPQAATPPPADDDDARLDLAEPDFSVVNLPTTLRLPKYGSTFHLTHRFTGVNWWQDSFSNIAGNLFGLDAGANIGLEYRFGVMRHLEAVVQRTTLSKTFQFSAKYDGWHQSATLPVSISGIVSIEGRQQLPRELRPGRSASSSHGTSRPDSRCMRRRSGSTTRPAAPASIATPVLSASAPVPACCRVPTSRSKPRADRRVRDQRCGIWLRHREAGRRARVPVDVHKRRCDDLSTTLAWRQSGKPVPRFQPDAQILLTIKGAAYDEASICVRHRAPRCPPSDAVATVAPHQPRQPTRLSPRIS